MKWFLATVLLIAGIVWCQDEVLNNLQDLQENTEFQEKSEDIEKVIKDKCVKAGGEKAFDELQIEKEAVMTCFQNLVDTEQIQAEIEEAKKTGSMDEVFAKYCKRKPEFLSCFNNFTNKLEKCLVEGEKNTLKIGVNLTETLIDFACYKDGDRLAMFIAEGGQECLTDKKDGLQDCFNKSMKNVIPSDFSLEKIPLLVIGESECAEFTTLQHCFVKELETCKDKTPANLVEAFFKFIRKSLPCSTERQALAAGDGPQQYLSSNYIRGKRQENELQSLLKKNEERTRLLTNRLKLKCEKNSAVPEAFASVNSSLNNLKDCTRRMFSETGESCKVKASVMQPCLEKFIVDLKQCLSDKEDFFPQFLRDAVNSTLNYLCEDEGKRLRDFRASTGLQCFTETNMDPLRQCFDSIGQDKAADTEEPILKQSSLCKALQTGDQCMTPHLLANCPNDDQFRNFVHGFLEALKAPCSGTSASLSNALLAALILFYVKKLWY